MIVTPLEKGGHAQWENGCMTLTAREFPRNIFKLATIIYSQLFTKSTEGPHCDHVGVLYTLTAATPI